MEKIMLPDRYEGLESKKDKHDITRIIKPVEEGIEKINDLYEEMESSNRGSFLILKGKSGCGKSTFLKTLDIFIEDIEIRTILNDMDLVQSINNLTSSQYKLRIVVIEGRESLLESSSREINDAIHSINRFVRSKNGKNTLLVWPCNDENIIEELVSTADNIGGTALLDLDETYFEFYGPDKIHFLEIAKQTVELLNNGKSLLDFGITDQTALSLINDVDTIGKYLKRINKTIRANKKFVESLVKREPCKMWVLVLAGNEPDKDVGALTKGEYLTADVNRMLVSTDANIVHELKKYPDKIGVLANYFDCRIIYIPIVTTLSIIRDFSGQKLREILKQNHLTDKGDGSGLDRLLNSELANMINSDYKLKARKGKTGPNSISAFEKLTEIASKNDKILNKTFGEALQAAGLIEDFKAEVNLGSGLTRRTDLVCKTNIGEIRLEFMWRKSTSQAAIANYTLTKLYNYGRAVGLL
ncbi:hypothetical protein [Bacillus paranthracis]|uniref:hypothetical protein n=1 Tax=Bacillus paranthracis TaxID=2026186 RepID=UPI002157E8AC|nr:hypothetical protein [Bacillus paranthracis]MCR6790493.1 hypothetical protein [Bacillus paranthracis]MED1164922.1 hypothetical protein [Bacillus paranthracis]